MSRESLFWPCPSCGGVSFIPTRSGVRICYRCGTVYREGQHG